MFDFSNTRSVFWVSFVCAVALAPGLVLQGAEPPASSGMVVINEVLASSSITQPDPQGEHDDWIEFYNPGAVAVDMAGLYVTDDLDNPTKWQFPLGRPELTTIPAQGYLLLWADNDTADPGLHAGFQLGTDGEEIGLYDRDGVTRIDSLAFGAQTLDVSYGRYPDGAGTWEFMAWPTPEDKNVHTYAGAVVEPQFSRTRGFCDAAFTLELTTPTEGATIYYKLDGTNPLGDVTRGAVPGIKYTGPLSISRTTCVRAGAIKTGWKSSATVTATYLFLNDILRQPAYPAGFPSSWGGRAADYAMDARVVDDPAYSGEIKNDLQSTPSVCLVVPIADFFASGGIYANPMLTGDTSERVASLEWIDPATGEQFGVNVGLRLHGGPYSRGQNPKNALRVNFRAKYGLSKLQYRLLPDTQVETFDTLALRSIWNYSWSGHSGMSGSGNADYLRDVFARDTVRDMEGLTPHGRPVQVYINGLYWGLYIMTERPTEAFAADHLGGDEEDYDVLEAPSGTGASTVMDVVAGGPQAGEAWNKLFTPAGGDLSAPKAYETIQTQIDVPAMIDYMLMVYYTGSRDAPVFLGDSYTPRNFYAIRHRDPASPFVVVPWDVEWALEEPTVNRVGVVGVFNPHVLMDRLAANADFRMLLADRIYRHFYNGGVLTREAATARYTARADEIRGAIVGESARWGDEPRPSQPYTRKDWEAEVNRLVTQYFSGRTQTVLNQLKSRGWYPSVSPPEAGVNGKPQRGGPIAQSDTVTLSGSGTIWYTLDGSDPRLSGIAAVAAAALTWVPENASKKVLVPTGPVSDAWRGGTGFDDSAWVGGTGGVGFERSTGYETYFRIDVGSAMYGRNASCYIRIPFDVAVADAVGVSSLVLKVRYDDAFVAYLNSQEVQRALFTGTPAWNSSATSSHEDAAAVQFETFDLSGHFGKLRPGANVLALQGINAGSTSSDFLISVELSAGKEAAASSSGIAPTAVRYTGPFTLDASARIKTRTLVGSTWSALNEMVFAVGPVAESLRISELMYHPANTGDANDPDTEYIELTNVGTQTINLNLVRFTDGIEFTFPSFELAPAGYCLVVRDIRAFEHKYGPGLPLAGQYTGSLNNAGEQVELVDAAGAGVCQFRYDDGWFSKTDGGGFSLTVKDPVATDADRLSDVSVWRPSTAAGGTPGAADRP